VVTRSGKGNTKRKARRHAIFVEKMDEEVKGQRNKLSELKDSSL